MLIFNLSIHPLSKMRNIDFEILDLTRLQKKLFLCGYKLVTDYEHNEDECQCFKFLDEIAINYGYANMEEAVDNKEFIGFIIVNKADIIEIFRQKFGDSILLLNYDKIKKDFIEL